MVSTTMRSLTTGLLCSVLFSTSATAQLPPTPQGVTTLQSKFHPGVKISYKEPGICETTPGVRSFAGYVHLPVDALNETHEHNAYPINTFYWFFESRKDPANAPLAIWLNGGPGGSSLLGALSENGPCFINNDSETTTLNPWSWNNEVNMLYIDQPDQVGYSYDVLTNITLNLLASEDEDHPGIEVADFSNGIPETNLTFLVGTSSSQKVRNTANSTHHAAVAMWHFAQTFFEEFPQYKPDDERISLFTESYGGHYGPGIMDYFIRQNERIANGTISGPGTHYLHLKTLGIINGCIDGKIHAESCITFPFNNTYGIQVFNESVYQTAMHNLTRPGGVFDAIDKCQELQASADPYDHGDIAEVNRVCAAADKQSNDLTEGTFAAANNGARFDITHDFRDPFPSWYMLGWLNSAPVQSALGVPVNHTWGSGVVATAFERTGDIVKGGPLSQLARVLDSGVAVALFHGDRDFACNWVGGEANSLAIPWKHQAEFQHAGYTPMSTSYPYTQPGGLVRQYGNLSFTRVYQAGHMVPSYQPEVAYEIFMRALTGRDVATGKVELSEKPRYKTEGRKDAWTTSDVLPSPPHECYVRALAMMCTEEEIEWLKDGTAVVEKGIVVGRRKEAAAMEEKGEKVVERVKEDM